ncbi:hypothetical protein RHMOL_Rhmol05G0205300 [Rhododendron molle]|uniref:Uncharacterized protein n=1 Tax=Rhododendron molle TaxID=49168 RepID=A0ACC0NRF5_RHOML|nr:hypothetical protein RHMOL_Rhmol05G0205300 [Rhododendron molle]
MSGYGYRVEPSQESGCRTRSLTIRIQELVRPNGSARSSSFALQAHWASAGYIVRPRSAHERSAHSKINYSQSFYSS